MDSAPSSTRLREVQLSEHLDRECFCETLDRDEQCHGSCHAVITGRRYSSDCRVRFYGLYFAGPFGFALYASHYLLYDWDYGSWGVGLLQSANATTMACELVEPGRGVLRRRALVDGTGGLVGPTRKIGCVQDRK